MTLGPQGVMRCARASLLMIGSSLIWAWAQPALQIQRDSGQHQRTPDQTVWNNRPRS